MEEKKGLKSWIKHAEALIAEGRCEDVIEKMKGLLSYNPDDGEAHALLGEAYFQKGSLTLSEIHYRKALISASDVESLVFHGMGNLMAYLEKRDDAMKYYLRAMEADREDSFLLYDIGNLLSEEGDPERASNYYTRAVEIDSDISLFYYGRARAFMDMGLFDESREDLMEAEKLAEADLDSGLLEDVRMALAELGMIEYDLETACHYYHKVLEGNPFECSAIEQLAYLYLEIDQIEKARQIFLIYDSVNPNNSNTLIELGKLEFMMGNNIRAVEYFNRVLSIDNRSSESHLMLGLVFRTMGRPNKAVSHLRLSIDIDDENPEAYYNLACVECEKGNHEKAHIFMQLAVNLDPDLAGRALLDDCLAPIMRSDYTKLNN